MKKLFKKKKDFEELEEYDEYSYDEPEIIESHSIEELEEYKNKKNKKYKLYKRIINIFFIIIVFLLILVTVDVIAVSKYNVGPFFAINTKTYKDGGTKEYYGLGYKVIKYHQLQGRRDTEVGSWGLKYNDKAFTVQDLDLAINLSDNKNDTYNNYYKKFVRIISTLKSVDTKKHTITLSYTDEDGKYSLDIICKINKDQDNLEELEKDKETTVIGTIYKFKDKTDKKNNRVYIKDCFAEQ